MTRTLTGLIAAVFLLAVVAAPSPAHADPWRFLGGVAAGIAVGTVIGPALGYPYGFRSGYAPLVRATAPWARPGAAPWAVPPRCHWARIERDGVWHHARVCD